MTLGIIAQTVNTYAPSEYGNYIFTASDTFASVASKFNTTPQVLAQINNITGSLPTHISDVPQLQSASSIRVPMTGNGGSQGTPNYYYYERMPTGTPTSYATQSAGLTGTGGSVILVIGGYTLYMPCYPKSLSDTASASYSQDSLFTSTEPYVVYSHGGPREVSVSFQLHREMRGYDNDAYIDTIVNTIQAACYPSNGNTIAVQSTLAVGNQFYIRGVINGGVTITPSGPIIDGKYNIYDISFSILEITGNNMTFGTKRSAGTRVGG
jgi:hypothetical protein